MDISPAKNNNTEEQNIALIETYEFDKGTVIDYTFTNSKIAMILDGECEVYSSDKHLLTLGRGSAVLFPIASNYKLHASEKVKNIIYRIDDSIKICDKNTLASIENEISDSILGDNMPHPIIMNDKVWDFAISTLSYINDGMTNKEFLRLKVMELFHILQNYYSKEEFSTFIMPILSPESKFEKFVYQNWNTASSLSSLAERYNLSVSGFAKKFKKTFGLPTYQWIMERKSEAILQELTEGDKSFKHISEEYNFSSIHHFNSYCKKRFGLTPGQIRASGASQQEV